jgi:hypothetical protein
MLSTAPAANICITAKGSERGIVSNNNDELSVPFRIPSPYAFALK